MLTIELEENKVNWKLISPKKFTHSLRGLKRMYFGINRLKGRSPRGLAELLFLWVSISTLPILTASSNDSLKYHITSVGMETFFMANSNSIGESSFAIMQLGGYIDANHKREIIKRLKNVNRIGLDFYGNIRLNTFTKNNKNHYIELGAASNLNTSFSKNLVELALYGNGRFAGEKVELGNVNYRSISWLKAGYGFVKVIGRNYFETNVNLIVGLRETHFIAKDLNIFTQDAGEFLDVNANIQFNRSKPYPNPLIKLSGFGLGLDATWKYFGSKYQHQVWLTDLGGIIWTANPQQFRFDSSFVFNGVDIPNIAAVAERNFVSNLHDSVKNEFTKRIKNEDYLSFLPAIFRYKLSGAFANDDRLAVQFTIRPNANFAPRILIEYSKVLRKNRGAFVSRIGLGGYGDYDLDIGYSLKKNNNVFSIYLLGVESVIVPKYNAGVGIYIGYNQTIGKR